MNSREATDLCPTTHPAHVRPTSSNTARTAGGETCRWSRYFPYAVIASAAFSAGRSYSCIPAAQGVVTNPSTAFPPPTASPASSYSSSSCRDLVFDSLSDTTEGFGGSHDDVWILRGGGGGGESRHRSGAASSEFVLYVPEGYAAPPASIVGRWRGVLVANPSIDALGGNTITRDRAIDAGRCRTLELCHWTLITRFAYACAAGPLQVCDATSPTFLTRGRHAAALLEAEDAGLGPDLAPLSFFLGLKRQGGAVVATDASALVDGGGPGATAAGAAGEGPPLAAASVAGKLAFVRRHAVDEIRERDTGRTIPLCTSATCDAGIVEEVLLKGGTGSGGGKAVNWSGMGVSMPTFAHRAYVEALRGAVDFLSSHNVTYNLAGGAALGAFKLGGLLPWDSGDVDFHVDHGDLSCRRWMEMVGSWADRSGYLHPHVDPAGATCEHYGVYAMPRTQRNGRATDVRDPWSIGLVTFTKKTITQPLSRIRLHGVEVSVPRDLWGYLRTHYKDELLQHRKHNMDGGGVLKCAVAPELRHNCLIDTDGTHLDTCMEHTQFGLANYELL